MGYINHHETLETLATHLVHEDCIHVGDDAFGNGETSGHCYDCTLAHLKKEFDELREFKSMYEGLCK